MSNIINILATPKPFTGHVAEIQKRAITNWLSLGENVRVTVLSDDVGKFLPIGHPRLRVLPVTDRMRNGSAPEFTEVLEMAEYCDNDYVLYCNSDILFTPGLLKATEELTARGWILCGRRVDLKQNIIPPVDPVVIEIWLKSAMARGDAFPQHYCCIDYFGTVRKTWRGFGKAFIGRAGIDGALLAHLMRNQINYADCTGLFWAVHQWHDYGHLARGKQDCYKGDEGIHNLKAHKIRYGPPTLLDADFFYDNGFWCQGFKRRSKTRTIERFLRFRLKISSLGMPFAAMRKLTRFVADDSMDKNLII